MIIGFSEEEEAAKGYGHESGEIGVRRKWFGLTPQEEEKLFKKYETLQQKFDAEKVEELLISRSPEPETARVEIEEVGEANE